MAGGSERGEQAEPKAHARFLLSMWLISTEDDRITSAIKTSTVEMKLDFQILDELTADDGEMNQIQNDHFNNSNKPESCPTAIFCETFCLREAS